MTIKIVEWEFTITTYGNERNVRNVGRKGAL